MKNKLLIPAIIFGILITLHAGAYAQEALKPRPSPLSVKTMKYEDSYVKITYNRPHKKGREIFGADLVPYGKVWRTGANEATEITVTKDVKLGGHKIKAGTYSIFTIPQKDKWTIIINKALGQWLFEGSNGKEYSIYDKSKIMFQGELLKTLDFLDYFTIHI